MKLKTLQLLSLLSLTFIIKVPFAQNVGINTTGAAPNASAILDLNTGNAGTMGFLPEQVALTATNTAGPIVLPATALLVYNTATAGVAPHNVVPGYYYNSGTPAAPNWVLILAGSLNATDWLTTGNTGTVDGVNFLGTIDNVPLTFKMDNQKSGRIDGIQSNTFFGYQSGGAVTSQTNTAIGAGSLQGNTTGSYNTAIGGSSLSLNNTGIRNTACGTEALQNNTSGSDNAAVGYAALFSNTNSINNTACGYAALELNTTGGNNTSTGASALTDNVTANDNTADGNQALYLNTYASNNTALGSGALQNQAYANGNAVYIPSNTAVGFHALFANNPTSNINGALNTAIGANSMAANTIGADNTALGYNSLTANTTGLANTAIGYNSMTANTTSSGNTGVGTFSLQSNTAANNTAIGYFALAANTTGIDNTSTGEASLSNNVTASDNTANGFTALRFNTYAGQNTAVGSGALSAQNFANGNVAFASSNTAIGYQALAVNNPTANTNGNQNTSVGGSSLSANTIGAGNTALGYQALNTNTTGTNNTAIGFQAEVGGAALTNAMALGNATTVAVSNSTEIGNANVVYCGINGAANNPLYALSVGTAGTNGNAAFLTVGGVWTNTSDRNKKENISALDGQDVLSKVCSLPIFRWNYKGEPARIQHIGPMAQDFYSTFHVGVDSLSISTIDPAGVALVAIKELNKKLENQNQALKQQVDKMANAQTKDEQEIADLKKLVNTMMQTQASAK